MIEGLRDKVAIVTGGGHGIGRAYSLGFGGAGAVWQAGFFEREIRSEKDLSAIVAYIEENPVANNLCAKPADYAFSTANEGCPSDLERYFTDDRAEFPARK